jgi:hypothetical protein
MKGASPRNKCVSARRMAFTRVVACMCTCFAVVCCVPANADTTQISPAQSQAQIRAEFIFNFSKFAEWPMHAYADAGSPMMVCFVGAEDVRAAFQSFSAGKAVTGRFVEDRAIKLPADLNSCQVVYVDSPNSALVVEALKFVRQTCTLSIGTSDDFLSRGGMIRLVVESNRLRFDVNVGAAARTKLKLSSKILALARSVVDLPDPAGN